MSITLSALGATDVGLVRERNEDALVIADLAPARPDDEAREGLKALSSDEPGFDEAEPETEELEPGESELAPGSAPDDSAPDESASDDSALDESALDDSAPDDSAPDESAPDDSAPGDSAPDEPEESKRKPVFDEPEERAAEERAAEEPAPEEPAPQERETPERETPEPETPEPETPEPETPEPETPEPETPEPETPEPEASTDDPTEPVDTVSTAEALAAIDTDPTRLSTQIVDKTIIMGDRGVLLAVLDGMGGAASGDVASALGREVLLRGVHEATIDSLQDLAEALGAATVQAHSAIRDRAAVDSSCSGMGTTLTAAGVLGDQAVIVQIGDSRAYVLRGGELVQVTEDQSLASELLASGRLSPEEAANYEHSNVILQALGVNDRVYPSITKLALCQGDVLLLCTDGLTDMVRGDTLSQTVRDGADDLRLLAQTLTTKAKLAGGFDNISVVLARCEGSELPDARAEPPSVEPMKVASTPTAPPPVRRRLEIALLLAALFLMLAMAGVIILLG